MTFLTTTKLVSKKLRPRDYRQYLFELLLLFLLCSAYLGYSDLGAIRSHQPVASAGASDFIQIGALGIYGIRLSSIIAMVRNYRMPQTLEWLAFIVPMAIFVLSAASSGHLVKLYAASQGYRFCHQETQRFTTYVFASAGVACPVLSTLQE